MLLHLKVTSVSSLRCRCTVWFFKKILFTFIKDTYHSQLRSHCQCQLTCLHIHIAILLCCTWIWAGNHPSRDMSFLHPGCTQRNPAQTSVSWDGPWPWSIGCLQGSRKLPLTSTHNQQNRRCTCHPVYRSLLKYKFKLFLMFHLFTNMSGYWKRIYNSSRFTNYMNMTIVSKQ